VSATPQVNEKWRYKKNRGSGTFIVRRVYGERVSLRDVHGFRRDKSVSLRTLRSDYERVTS
jgi:hypothetical protein